MRLLSISFKVSVFTLAAVALAYLFAILAIPMAYADMKAPPSIVASGTWTPGISFGATAGTVSARNPNYILFSDGTVFIKAGLDISSKNGGTGAVTLTGLPYPSRSQDYSGCVVTYYGNLVSITGAITGITQGTGSSIMDLSQTGATTPAALTDTNFGVNPALALHCFYTRQ